MYTIYYDDSGSRNHTLAVVVAGVLSSDDQWIEFERNWSETLMEFGIDVAHMREFAHSRGIFAKWADHMRSGFQRAERNHFLSQLLGHMVVRVRHCFAQAVLDDDYEYVNERYPLARGGLSPYALAGRTCIARVSNWAAKHGIPESEIKHVFEDGTLGKGDLMDRVFRDKGIEPIFKKKSECIPLQASDLFAYEYLLGCRDIFQRKIDKVEGLRFPIRQLESIPHDDLDWGTYSRADLEKLCQNAGIPRSH
jgi:hypothetical protein